MKRTGILAAGLLTVCLGMAFSNLTAYAFAISTQLVDISLMNAEEGKKFNQRAMDNRTYADLCGNADAPGVFDLVISPIINEITGDSVKQFKEAAPNTYNALQRNAPIDVTDIPGFSKTVRQAASGDSTGALQKVGKKFINTELNSDLQTIAFSAIGDAAAYAVSGLFGISYATDQALEIGSAAASTFDTQIPWPINIDFFGSSGSENKNAYSADAASAANISYTSRERGFLTPSQIQESSSIAAEEASWKAANGIVDGISHTGTESEKKNFWDGITGGFVREDTEAESAKLGSSREAAGPGGGPGSSVPRGSWWPFGAKQYVREVSVTSGEYGGSTKTIEYHYDSSGKLQYMDWNCVNQDGRHGPVGGRVYYECDQNGRWLRDYSNERGLDEENYHYDESGRLTGSEDTYTETGENGTLKEYGTTRYEYDQEGKIIRKIRVSGSDEQYQSDGFSSEDHTSCTETGTYTYDSSGVLQSYEGNLSHTDSYRDIDLETGEETTDSFTYTETISSTYYY